MTRAALLLVLIAGCGSPAPDAAPPVPSASATPRTRETCATLPGRARYVCLRADAGAP